MSLKGATESVWANLYSGGAFVVAFSGRIADLSTEERDFIFKTFDATKLFRDIQMHESQPEPESDTPEGLKIVFK